jgi:pterin-4a-carbinolamine dehydratase
MISLETNMARSIFISYRRDETADAAQAVFAQLRSYFGSGQVFMDVNTIEPSDLWPARLRDALMDATCLVCIIGRNWLFAHDSYGRRRLDQDNDWVCNEIAAGLRRHKAIYPALIGHEAQMPPKEALPTRIRRFAHCQATRLTRDNWIGDLTNLARLIEKSERIAPVLHEGRNLPYPNPTKAKLLGLTSRELQRYLRKLDGWEPWSDSIPSEYPHKRQELRRNISFNTFKQAMAFMHEASKLFSAENHHPRWGNEWKLVTIRLTTWDAGNKITKRDVEVAAKIDALVREFKA